MGTPLAGLKETESPSTATTTSASSSSAVLQFFPSTTPLFALQNYATVVASLIYK